MENDVANPDLLATAILLPKWFQPMKMNNNIEEIKTFAADLRGIRTKGGDEEPANLL